MFLRTFFAIGVLVFATPSTVAQDSEKEQTKMEEVMDTHNQVMDRMPELAKLIGKLETKASNTEEKKPYQDAVKDLKSANKSMMNWMVGFGNRFEADEMMKGKPLSEQKQQWLLEEEQKVRQLREEINLSIKQGEKILAQ